MTMKCVNCGVSYNQHGRSYAGVHPSIAVDGTNDCWNCSVGAAAIYDQ